MSGWFYIKSGTLDDTTEAPLSDAEFLALAETQTLSLTTRVAHQVHTKGAWVEARQLPAFKKRWEEHAAARREQAARQRSRRRSHQLEVASKNRKKVAAAVVTAVGVLLVAGLGICFRQEAMRVGANALTILLLLLPLLVGACILAYGILCSAEPVEEATAGSVRVVSFDMPFRRMVKLTFKWAIAAIPAFALLYLVAAVLTVATFAWISTVGGLALWSGQMTQNTRTPSSDPADDERLEQLIRTLNQPRQD